LQLLVSVRHPAEVTQALIGGAQIIDAKEPSRGSLGPVTHACLRQIDQQVPPSVPLSVALGDFTSADAAAEAVLALPLRPRRAPVYLKLAPAGNSREAVRSVLNAAVRGAGQHRAAPLVIAVEYADRSPDPQSSESFHAGVILARVRGILVDTAVKDGRTLLDRWSEDRLAGWSRSVREAGLLAAVAGGLSAAEVARVSALGCDVIGVRGAACIGGRSGRIDAGQVRMLREAIRSSAPKPRTATVNSGDR
jgi:uncharacterized protein (UPF0264 family)